jgi:hypothetical protein
MLLTLPRELRDHIIDEVLLNPEPKFIPVVHSVNDPKTPEKIRKLRQSPFPIPPFRSNLLAVCAQLRAETTERASKLDIPIVLDILSLEDDGLRFTWRSRPWGMPSEWGRIPQMVVQLRIQPLSLELACPSSLKFARECTKDETFDTRQHLEWVKAGLTETLATHTTKVIGLCVLSILQGDEHKPADADSLLHLKDGVWRDRPRITRLPNSIANLSIDFSPALDQVDRPIGVPPDGVLEEWYVPKFDFNEFLCFGHSYDEETLLAKDYLWPRHEGALSVEQYPVITHVGSISVCWGERPIAKMIAHDKSSLEVGGAVYERQDFFHNSPQDCMDVREVRKQLGW